ncbi:integrase [Mesorhizobium sp.]|uniref:integrase n=1 Tax=Mesorhizobium sp. TaxID=1871066 RepID=UPI0025E73AA8|nr:integrase [Mesorhizobium sp.]
MFVRRALFTTDRIKARTARDLHEAADNALWASLMLGESPQAARSRYHQAIKRAESLGFVYRPLAEILVAEPLDTILQRVESTIGEPAKSLSVDAVAGAVARPDDKISEALKLYFYEIARDEIRTKSPDQKKRWKAKREMSVDVFIGLVSDKPMGEITRDDARAVHKYWLDRIAPEKGRGDRSASTGNRNMGNLRTLYADYFRHLGFPEQKNPFADLSFADKSKRTRPPFATDWIRGKIFAPGALAALNDEARGIVLAFAETGARPSELANLHTGVIHVDHKVPHISVEPRDDPDDPREIKTASSVRKIPLVGVALEVSKKHPSGFPRYKDREASLSALLNKHFKSHGLFPTDDHTVYSLRHSFEDRMKNGRLDEELRRMLMGHTIDRPKYGEGGDMKMWQEELMKIVLPFDPGIV